jgi:hypothetical protein
LLFSCGEMQALIACTEASEAAVRAEMKQAVGEGKGGLSELDGSY